MSSYALVDRKERIHDSNLTGFCIILALFSASLAIMPIVSSKIVSFGPWVLPSSVFLWAMTYPMSDIVAEVYGRRYAYRLVLGGFVAYAFMFSVIETSIRMPSADFWDKQEMYVAILGTSKRIVLAAIVSYLVTQFIDVAIFSYVRHKTKGRYLWIRNNVSTFFSQTLANIIFLFIGFWGILEWDHWKQLFLDNLMMRYLLVLSDTVIVYVVVWILYKIYPELKENND